MASLRLLTRPPFGLPPLRLRGNKGEAQTSDALRAIVLRGPPEAIEVASRLIFACMRSPGEMEAVFAELRVRRPQESREESRCDRTASNLPPLGVAKC